MGKPLEWRVHVGAHKTATTHLQGVLDILSSDLNGPDMKLLPMAITRPAGRAAAQRGGLRGIARMRETIQMKITHAPRLERAATDTRLAVLSEEDLLGWTRDLFEDEFYPRLDGLDLCATVSRGSKLKIYLSIRDYPALLQSAFFEVLKASPQAPEMLKDCVASLISGQSGWVRLAERICARTPDAELFFWQQEDYGKDPQTIVEHLLGRTLPPLPKVPRSRVTATPNAYAMPQIARLDPAMPEHDRIKRVEDICARNPRYEGPDVEVISPQDRAALSARYAQDLAVLRARYTDLGQTEASHSA